jgi:uncharacterized protein (TIGR01777 family)
MRIAIAGASGLIGQSLIASLTEAGHEVIVLVRPGSKQPSQASISWDPKAGTINAEELSKAGPIDAIVNLAGAGIGDRRWNAKRKNLILESRLLSTNLLVKTVNELGADAPLLVNASAIGFYGSRGDEKLDENSSKGAGFLSEVCAAWEGATSSSTSRVALLRTGIVMSKRGGALGKQLLLFKLGLGGALGTGKQWISPISLEDEVRAIIFVIEKGLTGPINLVAPAAVTNKEFTKGLARVVRRPALLSAPAFALKLVLGNEMANELLLISQRVVPTRLVESGFEFKHPDLPSILEWAVRN